MFEMEWGRPVSGEALRYESAAVVAVNQNELCTIAGSGYDIIVDDAATLHGLQAIIGLMQCWSGLKRAAAAAC